MKISFFEEFPTKKNLDKLKLINWPSTVYVATTNIEQFKKIETKIENAKIKLGYWPVLEKKDGYWLSPFSSPKAIKKIIDEINSYKKPVKVMWDAELPLRHPWLFLRGDYFLRNRLIIKTFIKNNGKNVLTCEYLLKNKFMELIFKNLGVSFTPEKYGNKKIVMYYTSMHKLIPKMLHKNIENLHQKYGKNLQVGLGTIATGILGNEPILSPQNLKKDLASMKKIGIKEVVIFRLGGLNKTYLKVLKKYV